MRTFAVATQRGPAWNPDVPMNEQAHWDAHAEFANGLAGSGAIVLGGPIDSGDVNDLALVAMKADDVDHVHALFAEDPWVVDGILRIKHVWPWRLWLDSRG